MKGIWVSSILFLMITVGMFFTQYMLEEHSDKMIDMLTQATDLVKKEKWNEAFGKTEEIEIGWEKDSKWISMLVNHNETEEILKTVYAMKEYVRYREVPELMATAATLKGLFEHIPAKERPSLENIF